MARKNAKGSGTIRKKTVTRSGKEYTYWEARITTGRDPGTGKQIQRSFTGKTQKEVREKMQAAAVAHVQKRHVGEGERDKRLRHDTATHGNAWVMPPA